MEKTITISIKDARKWYLSGNDDLRAIALSAYTEDELVVVGLPASEEEFWENYSGKCRLTAREIDEYEAHSALRKLRDLYRGCDEWEYRERLGGRYQYCIVLMYDERHKPSLSISSLNSHYNEFLSFNDYKVAEKFLACFEDLIKKAGDLI
jgi:hypothetical protein